MAGKRYKHPETLKDRRPQRVRPPMELIAPGQDLLGDDLVPVPKAPTGLLPRTRQYWTELHRGPMAQSIIRSDGFALYRYIQDVDRWLRAVADLDAMRKEFVPAKRGAGRPGIPSMMEQLEELQEAQARGLIDDEEAGSARQLVLEAWASSTAGRPPVVLFYEMTWRIRQAIRQIESELWRLEQQFGLNPLARMRLNISAADAMSAIDKLNRQLDQGERDPNAEPEWVEAD